MRAPVRRTRCPAVIVAAAGVVIAVVAGPRLAGAQDWSAQVLPLVTRAAPTAGRVTRTEAYLTQPILGLTGARGPFALQILVDFEGWTLRGGELTTGAYGEGFVDRRHPHTYLHELMVTARGRRAGSDVSLAAGRGVVPFGTDDPMVRPALKYPVNHHLAQVLERAMVVGAARRGPMAIEVGVFGGDEPTEPASLPRASRFGDSWSARLTALVLPGVELSASRALVRSPEIAAGGGLDHHKHSVALRSDRRLPGLSYLLAEWARTDERDDGRQAHRFSSWLAEGARCGRLLALAARLERTDRPEEERLADPTRTVASPTDFSLLGVTTFTTVTLTVGAAQPVTAGRARLRPVVEIATVTPRAREPRSIVQPRELYGPGRLLMLSAGIRIATGHAHTRMGRYGAALPPATSHAAHQASTADQSTSCFAP